MRTDGSPMNEDLVEIWADEEREAAKTDPMNAKDHNDLADYLYGIVFKTGLFNGLPMEHE